MITMKRPDVNPIMGEMNSTKKKKIRISIGSLKKSYLLVQLEIDTFWDSWRCEMKEWTVKQKNLIV